MAEPFTKICMVCGVALRPKELGGVCADCADDTPRPGDFDNDPYGCLEDGNPADDHD